jgi:Spy/CpxP family protein refolding chaperone
MRSPFLATPMPSRVTALAILTCVFGLGSLASYGQMGGMSGGTPKPPMGPMKQGSGQMGGMPPAGMKPGSMKPMDAMACCGMRKPMPMTGDPGMSAKPSGEMSPMSKKSMSSPTADATPLLHVGAKDFFLDHATHLMLSADQRARLETIKSDATQKKDATKKQVDEAEQELWQLTSADQPDGGQIDAKVQQIATLNATEQIAFIHSVAASSDVLTPEQRAQVVMPTSPRSMKSPMAKKPTTAPMKMQ